MLQDESTVDDIERPICETPEMNRTIHHKPAIRRVRMVMSCCSTVPYCVLPDDTAGHSLAVAIESAMLAPKGQLSMYPWKDTPEKIPLAVRHVRSFLLSHRLA